MRAIPNFAEINPRTELPTFCNPLLGKKTTVQRVLPFPKSSLEILILFLVSSAVVAFCPRAVPLA